ncbi:MAG: MarR family transcriptional regulator [Candidatus Aenigmarchaeota archaeon]|nr:MarR family transcriptional regulator [Candidatus Aenigmarchaeota archaeon]
MKWAWFLAALAAVALLAAPAHAVTLRDWEVEVVLERDSSVWTAVLRYKENITKSDYFVLGRITDIDVIADELPIKCAVTERVGTSIVCDNVNARKMTYKFRLLEPPGDFRDFSVFRYRQSVTQLTDRFSMTVKLPLGAGLAEDQDLAGTSLKRFEPEWGQQGSDGRRIFVEWAANDPPLGETYDFSIIYESVFPENGLPFTPLVGLILMGLAVGIVILLYMRRSGMREVLPVLTEGERRVVEILLREKKEVDQRSIVRELDYSKSKVSRVVKNLIDRGLVEKIPKGRTNLLKLKKPSETAEKREKTQ